MLKPLIGAMGGIFLVVGLSYCILLAYVYLVLKPGAEAFANEAIPRIFATWSVGEHDALASAELRQGTSEQQVQAVLQSFSARLGRMLEYKGIKGGNVNHNVGGYSTAWFLADAVFERGPGTIRIELIRRDNIWQIWSWTVNSPAFLPPTPSTVPVVQSG